MPWDNLELRAHAAMIQAGVFLNWWEPPRMVVYSGVRGGLGLLGADFNMRTEWGEGYFDDTTVDLNGTLWRLKVILLGWDIYVTPNAVFSIGIGAQRTWLNNLTGTLTYEWEGGKDEVEIEVDPGIAGLSTRVEVGARIALGRKD